MSVYQARNLPLGRDQSIILLSCVRGRHVILKKLVSLVFVVVVDDVTFLAPILETAAPFFDRVFVWV